MRRLCVELNDGGQPVAGALVKITDCGDLDSAANGQAWFLVDAENFVVTVDGEEAYKGTLADAPEIIKLSKDGGGWKAA